MLRITAVGASRRHRLLPAVSDNKITMNNIRNRAVLSLVVVSMILISVFGIAAKTYEPSPLDDVGNMAAHRGGADLYPENTLTAFKAIRQDMPGVVLEFDVRALTDGTLVINHDAAVDRTTNGAGRVDAMSLDQWTALRVNGPNGTAPASTLQEVLDVFVGTDVAMFVELKDYSVADKFIEILFPHRGQIVVAAFKTSVAELFVESGFQTMQLSGAPPALIDGVQYVGVSDKNITAAFVSQAHTAGVQVWAWGGDVTADSATADKRGVDGFIADNPKRQHETTGSR